RRRRIREAKISRPEMRRVLCSADMRAHRVMTEFRVGNGLLATEHWRRFRERNATFTADWLDIGLEDAVESGEECVDRFEDDWRYGKADAADEFHVQR